MKVGSLFSGYGGLDMAVGGDLAWYSEIEPAACKVMEAHHPGVPNLGDITTVDWSQVEPVDVVTGGYPCQPFSNAGIRKGTKDERHLWPYVRDALGAIRPRAAVLENVRGHLTLGFDVVLADLASLGWFARWGVVRAADAGAPHNRARLFIIANAASAEWRAAQPDHLRQTEWPAEPGERARHVADAGVKRRRSQRPKPARQFGATEFDRNSRARWGQYAPAIARWEPIIGRPAPAPTVQRNDRDRLNPVFVEWMMGLPEGWVTGHGLSPSQELKMLGNGVVPQQAALALQLLGVSDALAQ